MAHPCRAIVVVWLVAFALTPPAALCADLDWGPAVGRGLNPAFGADALQTPVVHPAPASTSFRTLLKDTGRDFIRFPRRRSTWVILGAGLAAAGLAHTIDDDVQAHVTGSKTADRVFAPGKYLGATYTQMAAALGVYVVGRYVVPKPGESRTNRVSHLGLDLLRAQIESSVIVLGLKQAVRRDRPNGKCCAFPSGHAASTFAAASVLERHLGYRFAWPTVVGGFYVAASRLQDNVHYLSDVVFGAAVGTAIGWTVVGRHGHDSYALVPVPTSGGFMLSLQRRPAAADAP